MTLNYFKISNHLKNQGIADKIFRLLFLFGIIPLCVMTVIFIFIYFQIKLNHLNIHQLELTNSIRNEINAYIDRTESELNLIANSFQVKDIDDRQLKLNAIKIMYNSQEYDFVTVYNSKGKARIQVSRYHSFNNDDLEVLSPYIIKLLLNNQPFLSDITISKYNTFPYLFYYTPIFDAQENFIGAIKIGINISKYWGFLAKFDIPNYYDIYVIDQQGILIAYRNISAILQKKDLSHLKIVKNFLNKQYGVFHYIGFNNKLVIGATKLIDKTNWGIIVEVPYQKAFKDLPFIFIFALIILLSTVFFAFYFGFNFSNKNIVEPLIVLEKETKLISEGNYNSKIVKHYDSEIGQLADSFNHMVSKINEQTETIYKSERKFKAIFNQTFQFSALLSLQGILLEINKTALDFVGKEEKDEIGKYFWETSFWRKSYESVLALKKAFEEAKKGNLSHYEVIHYDKYDNRCFIDFSLKPFYDEDGQVSLLIAEGRDITDRKNTEELIQITNKDLERRVNERTKELQFANLELIIAKNDADSANNAKSEFLANMSHEIRTPMNAVLGFSELLEKYVTDPKAVNFLNGIKTSGINLLRIINDILDLSKIEAGKLLIEYNPVNLFKIGKEISQIFELKIKEKNLSFKLTFDDDLPDSVILDETRLRQILLNLVGNAVKFTDNGNISLHFLPLNTDLNHSVFDLIINVSDTGIGINQNQLNLIFDSFQQQDGQNNRKYGGTGLGLTISKRLAEMMKGIISVESTVNKGSVFTLTLKNVQICSLMVSSDQDINLQNVNYTFNNENILLVEDIESNRLVVKSFLEEHSLNIIEAVHGLEAIEILKKIKPDLILLDIMLPFMNGFQIYDFIQNNDELKNTPVIAITATSIESEINKILTTFSDYIRKPVSKKQLLKAISNYIKPQKISVLEDKKAESPFLQTLTKEFLILIKKTFSNKWTLVDEMRSNDDVINFALELNNFARINNNSILHLFAEDLESACKTFDLVKMNQLLDQFKQIIS